MSEKLIITQEQHDAVIKALGNRKGDRAQLIGDHSVMRGVKEHGVLNELTVSDMVRIVYDGDYEVKKKEPQYYPGQKVIYTGRGMHRLFTLNKKTDNYSLSIGSPCWDYEENEFDHIEEEYMRHATEEEIYWLHELGRDSIGDFREGDVIITQEVSYRYSTDGEVDTIGPHTTQLWLDEGIIKGIYPAESFKPFKEESGSNGH